MEGNKSHTQWWRHGLIIIIFCLAFYLRWRHTFVDRFWPDESLYAWCSLRIHENPRLMFSKEIIEFHPPLFPAFLSLWHFLFPPEIASRLGTMVLNSLAIIGIYILGLRINSWFVGLFSALALSLNPLHISQSVHVLIDGPLATSVIFLILFLTQLQGSNSIIYDVNVGLAASLVILVKWSGVLVLPLIIIYYLLTLDSVALVKRWQRLSIPLAVMIATIISLLINNWFQLGRILPDVTALQGLYLVKPFWYYALNLHNIIIIPFLLPFFFYGLFLICQGKNRVFQLGMIWFFIFFIGLSLMREKDLRYAVLILPSMILITAIGLENALQRLFKREKIIFTAQAICLVILLSFSIAIYPKTKRYLDRDAWQFIGFREAGLWIKSHLSEDGLLLAGSPRAIRYYSGINFAEFGGRIKPLPATITELKELIQKTRGPVYLAVDYWEHSQPTWVTPFPQAVLNQLTPLNFDVVKVIERKILVGDQQQTEPVVYILRHLQGN